MVQKKVAFPAAGAGVLLAGGLAGRRLVSKWRSNPDPLNGNTVAFPDGEQQMVRLPDGAEISTVSVGEGPAIVCVHGLTASRHDWGPMAPALLDAGYSLVAIEQRGHGDSTPGTAGYGSTQLGADLAVVLSELDLRPQALMGHSMGGMAAMSYAVHNHEDFRDRVKSMVLIATAGSLDTARHSVGLRFGGIGIPQALIPENDRLRLGAGLGVFGAKPSLHMIDEAIRSFRNCPEEVRQEATAQLLDHDVLDRLSVIDTPTMIIGAGKDQLIRPGQIKDLSDAISHAETHMFDGAGHMVIWERHGEIAQLLIEFVGKLGTP